MLHLSCILISLISIDRYYVNIYVSSLYYYFIRVYVVSIVLLFQAEDGIRDLVRSRGLGDVYKRQKGFFLFLMDVNSNDDAWQLTL